MPMTPGARRLDALVRFASGSLSTPEDVDRAVRDLTSFLIRAPRGRPGSDTGGVWFGTPPVPAPLKDRHKDELGELQEHVRRLFDRVIHPRPTSATDPLMLELHPPKLAPTVASDGTVILQVLDGSFSDRVLLALMLLLVHTGVGSVRECLVCQRLYAKDGKRLHCGRKRCEREMKNVSYRRWEQSEKGKRYYEEKVCAPNSWTPGARKAKSRRRER